MSDSSPASSSSAGSKTPASKPVPVSVGKPPGKPKSGPPIGGTSPSKPKSPVPAPPKAPKSPKLPKLPKPKSGWKPPKGSLPGYTPGHPPYHGSGGHLPIGDGGNHQDHGKASSTKSCIHPKGMERLRCQKADAVIVTLISIIALIITPFIIYKCIKSCQQRRTKRKNRHEEDGMELTSRAMNCDPSPQTDERVQTNNSNIGLAITTSEETVTLAKEQAQDISSGSGPAENPSEIRQPRTRNLSPRRKPLHVYPPRSRLNRGRSKFRAESIGSIASSLSSGMIRTAILGEAMQDPSIIDVQPSIVSVRKDSERMSSSGDADISNTDEDGRRDSGEEVGRECVVSDMESGDIKKEAESRVSSSSRKSSSSGPKDQSDNAVGSPDHSASRHSVSSSNSSISVNLGDDL